MKKTALALFLSFLFIEIFSQSREVNKKTLEQTYTYVTIKPALRAKVDSVDKPSYFNDDFFNAYLKKVILNKKYTDKEKAQIFYLMEKKVGYAFVGVDYVPPLQSYFTHHTGKMFIHQNTKKSLALLNYNTAKLLKIVDSNITKDAILAGNALLLAALLNDKDVLKKLEYYTKSSVILSSKNPNIFNHYACLSSSIVQNTVVAANLTQNLMTFKEECMLEDILCAIYSRDNFVTTMKQYILAEKNPNNELSIQTALCALEAKVPRASVEKSIQTLISEAQEKWKIELCEDLLNKKIPFNYSLSSKEQLVTKLWDGVSQTIYSNGVMILNKTLLEFDPN